MSNNATIKELVNNYYQKEFIQKQQRQEQKYQTNLKHQLERIKNLSAVRLPAKTNSKLATVRNGDYDRTNWRCKSQLKTAVNKTSAPWIDNPYATLQERDYPIPLKTKSPSLHREENVSTAPTA